MENINLFFWLIKTKNFKEIFKLSLQFFIKDKNYYKGYKRYSLEYTPIKLSQIVKFLQKNESFQSDLVIVPEIYKKTLRKNFPGSFFSTLDNIETEILERSNRLFWLSERVDRGVKVASHFYKKKKPVKVICHVGPARVWMHDQLKEKILFKEYRLQNKEKIQYFSHGIGADFGNLLQVIDNCKEIEGDFLEIGCFKGSSTCVMASYIEEEKIDKCLYVYDYFEGFTYKEASTSIDNIWLDTHQTDGLKSLYNRVIKRLSDKDKLKIYKRNIIDNDAIKEIDKIAFANIDVDLYEAIVAALNHVHKKLTKNGIIVVEDAGHTPALLGAKLALEEFLTEKSEDYICVQMESGQYFLIKK